MNVYRSCDIPVIRNSIFEPFLAAGRRIGVPIERHLRRAHLPPLEDQNPDLFLPEIATWRFVQSVAQTQGIATYGILCLEAMRFIELSSLRPLISHCANLNQLLQRVCVAAPLMSYSACYQIENRNDAIFFCNRGRRLLNDDIHAQLFQVFGMIQLVQLAMGPSWRPEEIHLTFPYDAAVESAPQLNPSRIHFSQRCPGILFPRHLLPTDIRAITGERRDVKPLPPAFHQQLSEIIAPYLGAERIDKQIAAEVIGVSPRTLQRRLDEERTSFHEVLEQLRLQKAKAMLAEPGIKLIEIAFGLGYENPPSFTRAFRRWTGVTPSEYRFRVAGEPRTG
jgi:AraC-like DNA-binding protein